MKVIVFLFFIFVLLGSSAVVVKVSYDYLSLPIAGINQAGICKYLIIDGKKQECKEIPAKYVKESIQGWE